MKILGVHDGHNSSAALLEDGEITWAIQEERMVNIKNESGMPYKALQEILKHTGELDEVALATYFIHEADWYRKQAFWEKTKRDYLLNKMMWPFRKRIDPYFRNRTRDRQKLLGEALELNGFYGWNENSIKVVEHHTAHAASAFYGSHYLPGEPVTVITADGSGDGKSATVSIGDEDGSLTRLNDHTATRNESIGEIYSLTTYHLGLRPWNDEYKIMGMAPYTKPDEGILNGLFSAMGVDKGRFTSSISADFAYDLLKKIYRRKRFDRISSSIQEWFEQMMLRWVNQIINQFKMPKKLACAGGDFMNVKTNALIIREPFIEDMFVFPSAGDESTSIGAAMKVYADGCLEQGINPKKMIKPMGPLYLGPKAEEEKLERRVKDLGWHMHYEDNIEKFIAELLTEGKIVARCSDRLEFGARALGNRTIMADARQLDIKVPLNAKIKHRDFWMPFAPSVSWEESSRLIDNPKDMKSPYMIMAFPSTENGQRELKAAMHPYDFTVRPQIVERTWNPQYWKTLYEFYLQTGCGGFLNTSFNLHGRPIVKDEKIALWTMERCDLEYLVVGNRVVRKG